MHITLKSVVALAAAVVSMAASAQYQDGLGTRLDIQDIDARQAQQQLRIERGIARGQITRDEMRTLRQAQRQIARAEARAKADGRVGRRELRELSAMLDEADAQIRQFRQDRDTWPPR